MQQSELLKILTGEENFSPAAQAPLQRLTKNYPWFGLPWYLLVKHSGQDGNLPDEKLTARALLHFSHPHLMKYRLDEKGEAEKMEPKVETSSPTSTEEKEPVEEINNNNNDEDISALALQEEETIHDATPPEVSPGGRIDTVAAEQEHQDDKNEEALLFEPLHTSDYFASQGIKFTEQPLATDKLGAQVKSFTAWLKSMKRINEQPDLPQNHHAENAVQVLAEKSNQDAEVVTESMAEVLLSQGKKGKAREIYEKLSLQNPAKSAYFAAKLQNTGNE